MPTMPGPWDAAFEADLEPLVRAICDEARPAPARDAAWRELVVRVAPHVEAWAARSRLLRRCGLTSEDEPRNVLVEVLSRLARHRYESLRRYLERRAPEPEPTDEALELVDRLARWGRLGEADGAAPPAADAPAAAAGDTPLRAWLLSQLTWAIKDHVRQRYGWAQRSATGSSPGPSKRDVNTNASPLDAAPEAGARPPLTDYLTLSRLLREIEGYAAGFPAPMKRALDLWLEDRDFAEIAAGVPAASPEEARALVRAAQARLRERFRDRWPL
jgi:hypothetical protein